MINRSQTNKQVPINIVGSSVFGRYPKIDIEKTYNMFISENFIVPYAGYKIAVPASSFSGGGRVGRGIYASSKLNILIVVIDDGVYSANIIFNENSNQQFVSQVTLIGRLQTASGVVYITENNKPQIAISDGDLIYIYDPMLIPIFQSAHITFTPGYITFHDTYFICAALADQAFSPGTNNTWRLSGQNDGLTWNSDSASVGVIQSKPDRTQAVTRFPSRGNLILVMGRNVTENWYDTGAQLFPYQRDNQHSIDYGCLSAATVAYMDELVVWLAINEKSGPIIVSCSGVGFRKITTDGIDYLFSTLSNPTDSQGFLFRQDGHIFYQINFYTDNLTLFYDFNTDKFYHASDQNGNYHIAAQVAFINDQYYFISKNTGNVYAMDTSFYNYQDSDSLGNVETHEIPRIRICKNIRLPSQEWFVINDIGFTIETGETNYLHEIIGPIFLITQDGNRIITEDNGEIFLQTQDNQYIETEDDNLLISNQSSPGSFAFLISQQDDVVDITPRVDLSISYDGGAVFGNQWGYDLFPIGQRRNKLQWWQCGAANDAVLRFYFWGIGRFVATDGVANIRQ